jgi:hypothetical protein
MLLFFSSGFSDGCPDEFSKRVSDELEDKLMELLGWALCLRGGRGGSLGARMNFLRPRVACVLSVMMSLLMQERLSAVVVWSGKKVQWRVLRPPINDA